MVVKHRDFYYDFTTTHGCEMLILARYADCEFTLKNNECPEKPIKPCKTRHFRIGEFYDTSTFHLHGRALGTVISGDEVRMKVGIKRGE